MSQRKGNKTNEFAQYQQFVGEALDNYREIRNKLNLPDNWSHSRTIEHMARPFIEGCFTIAVVGKVSAGKSTFINALLGCRDLLPTGHDQTTCGITYIEYGDKPEVSITFGDGHEETIKDDINGKIKPLVAIPDDFRNLPVNNIDEMIMAGWGFKQIWEHHEQLEEKTLCCKIDKSLLEKYISARQKKDIATEVRIKYPFDRELRGWKIIDTPGIGAIGGIELRTRQLLATQKEDGSREVDAIIFLQNGSQTLDQSDSKIFVKETLDNFTDVDRNRLFYVLTHASASDFRNHIEEKLYFIKANYGDKIKKLNYTDSLLYAFIAYVKKERLNLKDYESFEMPGSWSDDEWDKVCEMLDNAKRGIRKSGDTFNHETMMRTLSDWAHFDSLKKEINEFAKNEKKKCLLEIINNIKTDYSNEIETLKKNVTIINNGIDGINEEKSNIKKRRDDYNIVFKNIEHNLTKQSVIEKYDPVENRLTRIKEINNIQDLVTEIINLYDEIKEIEKRVFEVINDTYNSEFGKYDPDDITFKSIDFKTLYREVSNQIHEKRAWYSKTWIWIWGKSEADIQEEHIAYRKQVMQQLKNDIKQYKDNVIKQAENILDQVKKDVDGKLKDCTQRLKHFEQNLSDKNKIIEDLKNKIEIIKKANSDLESTLKEYGYDK